MLLKLTLRICFKKSFVPATARMLRDSEFQCLAAEKRHDFSPYFVVHVFTFGTERLKFPRRLYAVFFTFINRLRLDGALPWRMLFTDSNMSCVRRFS